MAVAREDYFVKLERIWPEGAWPCFSPDGRYLVFTGDLECPNTRLMLLPAVGGEKPKYITPPDINAKRPTWLHGVREIAFNRGQNSIWTIELDTGRIEPFLLDLPPGLPSFVHPCAYPNERAVVVVGFRETPNGREGALYKLTPFPTERSDVCELFRQDGNARPRDPRKRAGNSALPDSDGHCRNDEASSRLTRPTAARQREHQDARAALYPTGSY